MRSAPQGEPIYVGVQDGLPYRVMWGGRLFRVQSVEAIWCVEGRWWLDSARSGARRRYFRLGLRAPDGTHHCVEVYRQSALWKLWRTVD
jgi:hypothetical protein